MNFCIVHYVHISLRTCYFCLYRETDEFVLPQMITDITGQVRIMYKWSNVCISILWVLIWKYIAKMGTKKQNLQAVS